MPASVLAVGQRAIYMRKMVTEAFLKRGSKKTKVISENEKHTYFIQGEKPQLDLCTSSQLMSRSIGRDLRHVRLRPNGEAKSTEILRS
jgi:hypothetical protein